MRPGAGTGAAVKQPGELAEGFGRVGFGAGIEAPAPVKKEAIDFRLAGLEGPDERGDERAVLVFALATQQWWLLLLVPVAGYGFAWIGHFGPERNHPATFEFPGYSLIAEYKMFWLGVTGRMPREIERYYGDEATGR